MWTSIWQHKFQQHRLSYFLLVSATTTTTKSPPFRWPRFLIPEFFFLFRFYQQYRPSTRSDKSRSTFLPSGLFVWEAKYNDSKFRCHSNADIWHSALLTPASFQISNHTGTQNFISCNFRLYSFGFSSCGGVMDHHEYCSLTCRSNVRAGYFYCTWVLAYLARTAMLIPCNLTGSHLPWWLHRF